MIYISIIAIVNGLVEAINPILPKEQVIERVRLIVKEYRITQEELAQAIDITKTGVSKVFKGTRDLSYEEVQKMINYVSGRASIIPPEALAKNYATTFDDLAWAHDDEALTEVSKRMFEKGYSQLPVKNRTSGDFLGIISEISVMKNILHPEVNNAKIISVDDLGSLTIRKAGVIEEIPTYPIGSKMVEITQVLMNYYAVLLTKEEKVVGIITRADILKLFRTL
jgi:predicted transcriptional regulator